MDGDVLRSMIRREKMKDRKRTGARMVRERKDSLGSWCCVVGELGVVGGEICLAGMVEV